MERDEIERLAMDSMAGELNEDAEALFKEYLAEHPEANKWAGGMLEIYEKTGAAIEAKTTHINGISEGKKVISISPRLYVRWLPIARWAAVVIFAAFVGISVGRWTKSPVVPEWSEEITDYPDSTAERVIATQDIGDSFWREKALAMFQAKPSMSRTVSITGPNLWEKYRQFIKERSYE